MVAWGGVCGGGVIYTPGIYASVVSSAVDSAVQFSVVIKSFEAVEDF